MEQNIINTIPTFRTVEPEEKLTESEWIKHVNASRQYDHCEPWWKKRMKDIYSKAKDLANCI